MDDRQENNWKDKKINQYFRQVKPRPRLSCPAVPRHSVVAPPTAVSIEPFDPDLEEQERNRFASVSNDSSSLPVQTGNAQTSSRSSSSSDPTTSTTSAPLQSSDTFARPTSRVLPDTRIGTGSTQTQGRRRNLEASCQSSLNDPTSSITPQSQMSNGQVYTSVYSAKPFQTTIGASGQRPRKRFRKKVNGLFGEETDLHKRMSKLFRQTDISKISIGPDAADADLLVRGRKPAAALLDTGNLLSCLPGQSRSDSFDFIELSNAATKALGSPEKLADVKRSMGTLDPIDNERFLDELELGIPTEPIGSNFEKKLNAPKPPTLPSLDSTHDAHKIKPGSPLPASPKLGDRSVLPAIPAVRRCKTRRADRGYRSGDVIRARQQAAKTGPFRSSVGSSLVKNWSINKLNRSQGSNSNEGGFLRLRESRKRLGDNLSRKDLYSSNIYSKDDEDSQYPLAKRRRMRDKESKVNERDLEASPVTMATSDRENDGEDRRIPHTNPLTMLVEAATIQDDDEMQIQRDRHTRRRTEDD